MEQVRIEAQKLANALCATVYAWVDDDGGYTLNTCAAAYCDMPQAEFSVAPDLARAVSH